MESWHADHANANGLRLHYTRTGGDKPALVLAHSPDAGHSIHRVQFARYMAIVRAFLSQTDG